MRKSTATWLAAALLASVLCTGAALAASAGVTTGKAPAHGLAPARKAGQAQVTGAKVLAFGVFSSVVEGRDYSPGIVDGIRDQARDFVLVRRGASVEAALETGIGLRYQLTGSPQGAVVVVDVVVRHPKMVNPDTQMPMTHSTTQYERVIGAVEHSVWSFDTPGDLVPGVYVIEILHRGKRLARQAFQVTVKE